MKKKPLAALAAIYPTLSILDLMFYTMTGNNFLYTPSSEGAVMLRMLLTLVFIFVAVVLYTESKYEE